MRIPSCGARVFLMEGEGQFVRWRLHDREAQAGFLQDRHVIEERAHEEFEAIKLTRLHAY